VPLARYLEEELGLGKDGTVKVIAKFPDVLGLSAALALQVALSLCVRVWCNLCEYSEED